jgi:hypothetical protein
MRIEVLKPTQDDWYGTYELQGWFNGVKNQGLVQVSFCGNISPPDQAPVFRTCVWGDDDFGLEYDSPNEADAYNKFLQIIGMTSVDQQAVRELGFITA